MKITKKKKFSLVFLLIITFTTGCSWFFEPSSEAKNEYYDAGNKALNDGEYEEALSYYRQISRSSPFYPQALWMIEKVPFNKGVASYNEKKYQIGDCQLHLVNMLNLMKLIFRRQYLKLQKDLKS